jgi:hypothetical protein
MICDADHGVVMIVGGRGDSAEKIAHYVVKWLNRIAFITGRKELRYTSDDWWMERNPKGSLRA